MTTTAAVAAAGQEGEDIEMIVVSQRGRGEERGRGGDDEDLSSDGELG